MDLPLPFTTRLELAGPAGRLDARLDLPPDRSAPRFVAVFGHPHPQQGGTMFNNVVVHASRTLVHAGGGVLRFNFRGVGRSEGGYDEGGGEREDYRAALSSLEERFPHALPRLAAGFSFGSIRAMECAGKPGADLYLGVAVPLTLEKYAQLPPLSCPAALVLAGDDDHVPAPDEALLAERFPALRGREVVEGADHLFTDRLPQLRAAVRLAWASLDDGQG